MNNDNNTNMCYACIYIALCSYYFDPLVSSHLPPLAIPSSFLERNSASFRFCSAFKMEERKGWRELVRNFMIEFSESDDDAVLILRTYFSSDKGLESEVRDKITSALKDSKLSDNIVDMSLSRIVIISQNLSFSAMLQYYKQCDAFVLPTHGEGWGLPLHEAMSMGVPVLTTAWGGSTGIILVLPVIAMYNDTCFRVCSS